MNKLKSLICVLIMACAISTVSYAKGTVSGSGTEADPYRLKMGEGVIDINYEDQHFFFIFDSGGVNAGNYLVEHNPDKKRVRFTLIGTTEEDRVVVSKEGINYLQAGAITKVIDSGDAEEVQTPYYKIIAYESMQGAIYKTEVTTSNGTTTNNLDSSNMTPLTRSINLSNGYIRVNNTLGANVSNYSTAFIFSKSNLDYENAYKIAKEQVGEKIGVCYDKSGTSTFTGDNKMIRDEVIIDGRSSRRVKSYYNLFGPVDVIYEFNGVNSEVADSKGEQASLIERLLSKVLLSVGDAAINLLNMGETEDVAIKKDMANGVQFATSGDNDIKNVKATNLYVSLDTLVFNEFANTIVDFWGETKYTNGVVKGVVNFWYKVFKTWAIILFIILLICIGIKVVLSSGTPAEKNARQMLEGWIMGVALLFCLPFFFKYLIEINDAIVDIMRTNSKYSVYAYYSFQYLYDHEKEDGEDTATSVVEKLRNAKEALREKGVEAQATVEDRREVYNKNLEDAKQQEENYEATKLKIEGSLAKLIELYDNIADGHLVKKDGSEIRPYATEDIYNELTSMFEEAYKDVNITLKEGKSGELLTDTESFKTVMAQLEGKIKQYASNFYVVDSNGNEITKKNDGIEVESGKYTDELRKNIYGIALSSKDISFDNSTTIKNLYEDKMFLEGSRLKLEIAEEELQEIAQQYVEVNEALEKAENSSLDLIGMIRLRAGATLKLLYVIVWFVLLFQVLVLLFVYYKRLLTLAVLICIFPLVTAAYAYEVIKGSKGTILKNWLQEYIVNVFIQSIHAILYVTIVELGYTVYIANNDNWLIFLIAVFALLTVEPVFKNLLGVKGSTVAELGATAKGALALGAVGFATGKMLKDTGKDMKNADKAYKNREANIEQKHEKNDNRKATIRRALDNHDKKNGKEDGKLANARHKLEEFSDKTSENLRKKAAKKREVARKLRKAKIVANNLASAGVTLTGGLAGGDAEAFGKSAKFANAVLGTPAVESTTEADEREDKVNTENEIGDVKAENATSNRGVAYSGPGYDDYSYDGSGRPTRGNGAQGGNGTAGDGSDTSGGTRNASQTAWKNTALRHEFQERLAAQKAYAQAAQAQAPQQTYVETNWNTTEEDK